MHFIWLGIIILRGVAIEREQKLTNTLEMFDVGVLNTNLANALQSDKQTFEISDDSEQLVNFTNNKWKPTSHMEDPSQSQDLPQNTLSWFHGNQRQFPINMLLVNLW